MTALSADKPPSLPIYIAVGCVAGSVIALQIAIMRLFAVGSWAHFGSFVVSLAMMALALYLHRGTLAHLWNKTSALQSPGLPPNI